MQSDQTPSEGLVVPIGKNRDGPVQWHPHRGSPHLLVWGPVGSGKSVVLGAIKSYLDRFPDEWIVRLGDTTGTARDALSEAGTEIDRRFEMLGTIKRHSYSELNMFRTRHGEEPLPRFAVLLDDVEEILAADPALRGPLHHLLRLGAVAGFHLVLATQEPERLNMPHLNYAAKLPLSPAGLQVYRHSPEAS